MRGAETFFTPSPVEMVRPILLFYIIKDCGRTATTIGVHAGNYDSVWSVIMAVVEIGKVHMGVN
jgi:hypothetical protein